MDEYEAGRKLTAGQLRRNVVVLEERSAVVAAAEPGSPLRELPVSVGEVTVDLGPVAVEPRLVRCLDLDQDRVQRRAVRGQPHEVRLPVAEAGQLRLGDHRERERRVARVAVDAVRAGQQGRMPFQERLQEALVSGLLAVQERLPAVGEELLVGFLVWPAG